MKKLTVPKKGNLRISETLPPQKRRNEDRRKINCDGYTYIPMVGWFCRREQTRRNDEGKMS